MKNYTQLWEAITSRFRPALFTSFQSGYSLTAFNRDCLAGIIVGIVAIPLAIAFGIASGVSPTQGLITAVVAGFLISAFSGSHVQVGGPTGAFIVIIYGIVQKYGYDGLAVATIMAGIFLILLGAFGFGKIIKYIPYPVTVGFTAGIALIIFAGQIKDLLGLTMDKVPADFVEKILAYAQHIDSTRWQNVLIGSVTIAICIYWKRVTAKVPGSLIAVLVTTVVVFILRHFNLLSPEVVQTIGDRFPDVANGMSMPTPHVPRVSLETFREMVSPAISIALLAGIESLLSAVVADGMTGKRHHSNTELIGQGIANLCSPLFGGIPATGAIARTATNIKNGGISPVSGIVHAFFLLLVMLFLGKLAAWIPMATLGGIVAVVAYNMSEWRSFVRLFHSTKSDTIVMLVTFSLTVFIDLVVAIQAGVLIASFLFMRRTAETMRTQHITNKKFSVNQNSPAHADLGPIPVGVEIFTLEGDLFFGAADQFRSALSIAGILPRVLVLDMTHVLNIDATVLHALEDVYLESKRKGTRLVLCGVHSQPLFVMQRANFLDMIGTSNTFWSLKEAMNYLREPNTPPKP